MIVVVVMLSGLVSITCAQCQFFYLLHGSFTKLLLGNVMNIVHFEQRVSFKVLHKALLELVIYSALVFERIYVLNLYHLLTKVDFSPPSKR